MRGPRPTLVLAIFATIFCMPLTVQACPLCTRMPFPPVRARRINNAPLAYNHSIYLMAGMPYVLLSVFSFFIYRGCKKNDEYRDTLDPEAPR